MVTTRQTSFGAGELSPLLHGRTDLPFHAHGVRTLQNFVVDQHGSAHTRDGLEKCWQAAAADVVRLVPFIHANGDGYVLELTNTLLRAYNGRTLALEASVATPWTSSKLDTLQWAQFGSTVLFTSKYFQPYELTFFGSTLVLLPARFSPPGDTNGTAPMQAAFPSIGGNPPSMPVLVSWTGMTLFAVDAAHPPKQWHYKVSTLLQHNVTGEVVESLPRDITQYVTGNVKDGSVPLAPGSAISIVTTSPNNELVIYADNPVYIQPGLGAGVSGYSNWTPIANLYYRGRGKLFGLVGRSEVNERFADAGEEPDYTTPPLRGESPFRDGLLVPGSGELQVSGSPERPAACAFFQQRRVFAGTGLRQSTSWFSAVDEWANFDEPVINWPGQPLEFTLIGRQRLDIVALGQLDFLFAFTSAGVWAIGRDQIAMDYDTFSSQVRQVDEIGAWPIAPLLIDGALLYPTNTGRTVRSVALGANGIESADVGWHASHLFEPRAPANARSPVVRSWTFARNPHHTAWLVLGVYGSFNETGQLLSLSRVGSLWAWARHVTGNNDIVLSTCSVPYGFYGGNSIAAHDTVFMAVRRGDGSIYVERMTPRTCQAPPRYVNDPLYAGNPIGGTQMAYPVDSYVKATITTGTGTVVGGLSHLEGRQVWASCPGIDPSGPFTVAGGTIATPAGWGPLGSTTFKAAVGLAYTCELELLDAAPGSLNQKTVVAVGFEVDNAQGLEVGEDFEHLVEWQKRTVADSYSFPSAATALAVVKVKGAWRRTGRAALRQAKPLAATVLGVTRELETGGS